MPKINGYNLRTLREKNNLTLDGLAAKARVDRGTISKIENGKRAAQRASTLRNLADALGVEAAVLIGPDMEKADSSPFFSPKTQMNFKMANDARNALALTAYRYNVKQSHILHLAPFLFYWAAEMSLKWRKDRIDEIAVKLDDLSSVPNPKHLSGLTTNNWRGEEVIEEERRSIASRDLFGLQLSDEAICFGYEGSEQNPMADFLASIADSLGENVQFEHWSQEWSHPGYTLGLGEALQLVGDDEDAARHIVSGNAPLHEMPKEIRESGAAAIAGWASEKGAELLSFMEDLDRSIVEGQIND